MFFVNAPIGVLLLACYWLLPASAPARKGGLDLPGAVKAGGLHAAILRSWRWPG